MLTGCNRLGLWKLYADSSQTIPFKPWLSEALPPIELVLPDHATPISIKTHSCDPVPFAIMGKGIEPDGAERFDEEEAKKGGFGVVEATKLMSMLFTPLRT